LSASRSCSRTSACALDGRLRVRHPAVLSRTSSSSSTVKFDGGSGGRVRSNASKWCCRRRQCLARAAAADAAALAPLAAHGPALTTVTGADGGRGGGARWRESRERAGRLRWRAPARPRVGPERPQPRDRPPRACGPGEERIRRASHLCYTLVTLL
jgi:hypothetical protein